MPHFVLDIELAGAAFAGTQRQPQRRTVQGVLEHAAALVNGIATTVRPGSRLDGGVDALHLPCDLVLQRAWHNRALAHAFNRHLPADCRVRRCARVADGFNAMHRCVEKTYEYRCVVRGAAPVVANRQWWLTRPVKYEILTELAALLPGQQDLSAFSALRHDHTDHDDPIRTITHAAWQFHQQDFDPTFVFTITGQGFLYKQIRALVGGMITCASGLAPVAAFRDACGAGRGAPRPGDIAPAVGLTLKSYRLDPQPDWGFA